MSLFRIKLAHTAIFFLLSACVFYTLYCGITGDISRWTWIAIMANLGEGVVLAIAGWKCPLTKMAEGLGAPSGTVSDIFLPKWFANRIFPVCGLTFALACVLVVLRCLL